MIAGFYGNIYRPPTGIVEIAQERNLGELCSCKFSFIPPLSICKCRGCITNYFRSFSFFKFCDLMILSIYPSLALSLLSCWPLCISWQQSTHLITGGYTLFISQLCVHKYLKYTLLKGLHNSLNMVVLQLNSLLVYLVTEKISTSLL